ncbi:MAG: nucleotide sugar dehydrogenase, partial [Desulfobacteraceae bacterium]
FKEDCPDLRNTKVIDIIDELHSFGVDVIIHDPVADRNEAKSHYGLDFCKWEDLKELDALLIAVPHKEFRSKPVSEFTGMLTSNGCLIDVKSMLDIEQTKALCSKGGVSYWRL